MLTEREAPPTGESSPSIITGLLHSFLFHASAKLTENPGRVGVLIDVSMSDAHEANDDNSSSAARTRATSSHYSAAAELPRGPRIRGNCFNCDCIGHKAADCPKERRALPNMQQKPPKPPCQWHPGERSGTVRHVHLLSCALLSYSLSTQLTILWDRSTSAVAHTFPHLDANQLAPTASPRRSPQLLLPASKSKPLHPPPTSEPSPSP